jgi:hypothetical protein
MNRNSMILALLASLSLAGATAGTAQAEEASAPTRGTVQVKGESSKAVVVGPVAIHAYSAFSGAKLFVVNAVSGTDRDCAVGAAIGSAVAADHIQTFTVGAGQVACVATTNARGTELLWHAQKSDASSAPVMLASRR